MSNDVGWLHAGGVAVVLVAGDEQKASQREGRFMGQTCILHGVFADLMFGFKLWCGEV